MKFIGYLLIALANVVLADCGFNLAMWQWWVINLGFIVGEFMVCNGDK
jgi:hypothetical protein